MDRAIAIQNVITGDRIFAQCIGLNVASDVPAEVGIENLPRFHINVRRAGEDFRVAQRMHAAESIENPQAVPGGREGEPSRDVPSEE